MIASDCQVLRTRDLARLLGLSAKTIGNRLAAIRAGAEPVDSLPPVRRMNRRPVWLLSEAEEWLRRHCELEAPAEVPAEGEATP
ncbi:MAG: hypothetical protein JXR96_27015 [Deltaproteobacteria bacterium]|nr:hypothetical protein [Deltaproteobacteria bacterium]